MSTLSSLFNFVNLYYVCLIYTFKCYQALPEDSGASQLLRHGSRRAPKKNQVDIEPARPVKSDSNLALDQPKILANNAFQCNVTVHREM